MKKVCLLLLLSCAGMICNAQLLKKIGRRVKENVEWKAGQKANQKIDQGLDSLIELPNKIGKKNPKDNNKQPVSTPAPVTSKNPATRPDNNFVSADAGKEEEMGTKDGHIVFSLSTTTVFTGGGVRITGESVVYKNFKQVEVTVKGPSTNDSRSISLQRDGKFIADWNASDVTGEFTVTVSSSDKKAKESASFSVQEIDIVFSEDWPEANVKATKDAYDKLDDAVNTVEAGIGAKDKAELDKKMAEIKKKVDEVLKLFKDLNTAGKEISRLAKSGKKMPANLAGNLSALNDNLAEHARQMKSIERLTNHKAQDNTICEHLVMVNEACAAFSTFTNLWATGIKGIIKNIVLDKGVPKIVEVINKGRASWESEWAAKESSKVFATSLADAESLESKLGKAGFAGDLVQFASDVLLKKHCGVYKGELKHDYTVIFRNASGETWWKYGVEVQAAFTLRYPLDKSSGSVIKMKGNIEGNGTKFTFFQNVAVEDEFRKGTKANIEVVPLKTITPVAVPVATSQNDAFGFGAVARGAFTPAYFNIPVDAEYNTDDEKITLFLNNPIIDFSPAVTNQFIFLLVGGDLLPYFKRMNFPIHKVFRTLGSVVWKNNEFSVDRDSKGNQSFSGKANKHLGSKSEKIEHDLNFSVSAKKD